MRGPTAQKTKLSIKDSSVNVTKSAGNCGFGYIYWRNPRWKPSFFVQWPAWDCFLILQIYQVRYRSSGLSIVNFEHISHLALLSLILSRKMPAGNIKWFLCYLILWSTFMNRASAIIFRLFYTPFTPELTFHVPILTSSLVHVPFNLFLIFSRGHVFNCFLTLEAFFSRTALLSNSLLFA